MVEEQQEQIGWAICDFSFDFNSLKIWKVINDFSYDFNSWNIWKFVNRYAGGG